MPPLQRSLDADPWSPFAEVPGRLQALAGGNAVSLLSPAQAAQALLDAVDSARDHINVETDGFPCDELGTRLVDRMAERARTGVRVNLLHNVAGSARIAPVLQRLSGDTVRHSRFRPSGAWWRWLGRSHAGRERPRRMVGVDGRIGFLATGNAGESVGWNQTRLQLEGPIVQRLQREFVASWQRHSLMSLADARYFPPLAVRGTQGVALGPIQASGTLEPCRPWRSALLGAIEASSAGVALALCDTDLPRRLVKALLRARARGVQVQVWLPPGQGALAGRLLAIPGAQALADAGVLLQARTDSLPVCTVCVIDGRWTSLGAGRADWRSILERSETDLIVADEPFARTVLDALVGTARTAEDGASVSPAAASVDRTRRMDLQT